MPLRILFAAPYVPYPPHGGASLRMLNTLCGLASRGHEIHLLAGAEGEKEEGRKRLAGDCVDVTLYSRPTNDSKRWLRAIFSTKPYPSPEFSTSSYEDNVHRLLATEEFDAAWVNFLFMLEPFQEVKGLQVVLDQHEEQKQVWHDYLISGTLPEKAFAAQNLLKLRRWEPRYLSAADAVASVSSGERDRTRGRLPGAADVWTVPNGVDIDEFQPLPFPARRPQIVFVGGMGVKRNADAVRWFAEEIFPRIRKAEPDACFTIVGSTPLPEVEALEDIPGVSVTGTVPDVRSFYEDAGVVVVPQRFGAGTKLKVLEALALQRPLVSTPNGVQGIDIEDGKHALICEGPEAFASAVLSVLRDPSEGLKMAKEGRRLVEERYAWSAIIDELDQHLRRLVQE